MIIKSQYVIQAKYNGHRDWEDTINRIDVADLSQYPNRITHAIAYLRNNAMHEGEEYRVIIREINEIEVPGV